MAVGDRVILDGIMGVLVRDENRFLPMLAEHISFSSRFPNTSHIYVLSFISTIILFA